MQAGRYAVGASIANVEDTFWTALATSTSAAPVTSLGIYAIRRFGSWGQRNTTHFI